MSRCPEPMHRSLSVVSITCIAAASLRPEQVSKPKMVGVLLSWENHSSMLFAMAMLHLGWQHCRIHDDKIVQ